MRAQESKKLKVFILDEIGKVTKQLLKKKIDFQFEAQKEKIKKIDDENFEKISKKSGLSRGF